MKKTMTALFLIGSSCALFAQTPTTTPSTPTTPNTPTQSTQPAQGTTTTPSTQQNIPGTTTTDATRPNTDPSMNMNSTNNGTINNMNTGSPAGTTGNTDMNMTGNTGVNPSANAGMNNAMGTNTMYNAYNAATAVPSSIQSSFQRDYATASGVTWQQNNDWYRAVYTSEGRNMQVYYDTRGNSYKVALPVLNSFVPEEVISKAIAQYGHNIYAVNRVKVTDGKDAYQVTLIENGQMRSEWIGEDGSTVQNVYRVEEEDNAAADMNSNTGTGTTDPNAAAPSGSVNTTDASNTGTTPATGTINSPAAIQSTNQTNQQNNNHPNTTDANSKDPMNTTNTNTNTKKPKKDE